MSVIVEEVQCHSGSRATAPPKNIWKVGYNSGYHRSWFPQPQPPKNFGIVHENRVYRSGFPQPSNLPFLHSLNLKSILCFSTEPYPVEHREFLKSNGIELFRFVIDGTKEPTPAMLASTMTEALKVITDVRNHPVLIHCKSGRHRTGCLVGCLRILHNWRLGPVFEEYVQFAGAKSRSTDLVFLRRYDSSFLKQFSQYQYLRNGDKKHLLQEPVTSSLSPPTCVCSRAAPASFRCLQSSVALGRFSLLVLCFVLILKFCISFYG